MIAKFMEEGLGQQILEVQETDDGVLFSVYEFGEEQVGQHVTISLSEIPKLIKHLQSLNQLQ